MKKIPCEVYSRIVGYFRPVHNWNQGKQQEFKERVEFSERVSLNQTTGIMDTKEEIVGAKDDISQEAKVMPLVGGGAMTVDAYKIFTFPNCDKCETVKTFLNGAMPYSGAVIDLKSPEGNKEFRSHYSDATIKQNIKRGEDGTLKLPIVMFMRKGNVVSTAQTIEETKSFLS
jgi:hypothetical protein